MWHRKNFCLNLHVVYIFKEELDEGGFHSHRVYPVMSSSQDLLLAQCPSAVDVWKGGL